MEYTEFEAGLAKRPELINEIFDKHGENFTKHLTEKKGMIVTTQADFTKDREVAIGEGSKKAHEAWEQKIEALTGLKKNAGEKGLDFYDRVSAKLKFLKDGENDDTPEGRANNAALKTLQDEIKNLKKSLDDEKSAGFKNKVTAEVSAGVRALKFAIPGHIKDETLKASYQKDQVAANIALFNSQYTPEARQDGKIQYKDSKGEVLVDTDGEPLTIEAIFTKNHAHLLAPAGHQQGGSGSNEEDPNKSKADYLGKDAAAIEQKLAELGIEYMTPDWEEKYRKALAAIGKKL